jgi:hypothetical protein
MIRAKEPGVLTWREEGGRSLYRQPDCVVALRRREAEKARREHAPSVTLDEARTRKALAEAELAELEVAEARGTVVAVADYEAALGRVLDRLCARLRAVPVRLAHLGPEVEAVAEAEAEKIVEELHAWDEDVVEAPVDLDPLASAPHQVEPPQATSARPARRRAGRRPHSQGAHHGDHLLQ